MTGNPPTQGPPIRGRLQRSNVSFVRCSRAGAQRSEKARFCWPNRGLPARSRLTSAAAFAAATRACGTPRPRRRRGGRPAARCGRRAWHRGWRATTSWPPPAPPARRSRGTSCSPTQERARRQRGVGHAVQNFSALLSAQRVSSSSHSSNMASSFVLAAGVRPSFGMIAPGLERPRGWSAERRLGYPIHQSVAPTERLKDLPVAPRPFTTPSNRNFV